MLMSLYISSSVSSVTLIKIFIMNVFEDLNIHSNLFCVMSAAGFNAFAFHCITQLKWIDIFKWGFLMKFIHSVTSAFLSFLFLPASLEWSTDHQFCFRPMFIWAHSIPSPVESSGCPRTLTRPVVDPIVLSLQRASTRSNNLNLTVAYSMSVIAGIDSLNVFAFSFLTQWFRFPMIRYDSSIFLIYVITSTNSFQANTWLISET